MSDFYEEDEDPAKIRRIFDEGVKGVTAALFHGNWFMWTGQGIEVGHSNGNYFADNTTDAAPSS